jgi:hypothetical protein
MVALGATSADAVTVTTPPLVVPSLSSTPDTNTVPDVRAEIVTSPASLTTLPSPSRSIIGEANGSVKLRGVPAVVVELGNVAVVVAVTGTFRSASMTVTRILFESVSIVFVTVEVAVGLTSSNVVYKVFPAPI